MFLELETVSIAETVGQVMNTIEPIAAKKGVTVEANVGAAGRLQADPHKMVQMLLNLVTNAVKFTPEGGSVTIAAQRQAETAEISVTDTGIGIAKSALDRLFREFQQLDSGPGRHHAVTGLCLALTQPPPPLHVRHVPVLC